jgi:tetratricopeptide (TPR) repeat protein
MKMQRLAIVVNVAVPINHILRVLIVLFLSLSFVHLQRASGSAADPIDYFAQHQDTEVRERVRVVEIHHLNANFWENFKSGKLEYALQDVDFVLRWVPNHPQGLLLIGSIAKLMKRPSLAIRYYDAALAVFPQYAATHAQYGSYLVDIGAVDDGVARLERSIELDPNLIAGHVWLAGAYYKSGRRELARGAVQKARALGYKGIISGE